jgi:hypothetical protein
MPPSNGLQSTHTAQPRHTLFTRRNVLLVVVSIGASLAAFALLRTRTPSPPVSNGLQIMCNVAGSTSAHVFREMTLGPGGANAEWSVQNLNPRHAALPCLRMRGTAADAATVFNGANIEVYGALPDSNGRVTRDEDIVYYATGDVPTTVRLTEHGGFVYLIPASTMTPRGPLAGNLVFSANVSMPTKTTWGNYIALEPVLLLNEP